MRIDHNLIIDLCLFLEKKCMQNTGHAPLYYIISEDIEVVLSRGLHIAGAPLPKKMLGRPVYTLRRYPPGTIAVRARI